MNSEQLDSGLAYLAEMGLNLVAAIPCERLPDDVFDLLVDDGIDVAAYRRLVLIGHGGRRMWEAFTDANVSGQHPIDRFSVEAATDFVDQYLPPAAWRLLYPGPLPIPLQRLGELAGWTHPSPLGSGISVEYGLWFAYRAAFLTAAAMPVLMADAGESPCHTCATRDCVSACPARAVRWGSSPDLAACIGHRLAPESSCALRCQARLVCPYAPQHRYGAGQLDYHYGHSLDSIRRHMAQERADNGI